MDRLCNINQQTCRETITKDFFAGTSKNYDSFVNITTFGADSVWKMRMLDICKRNVSNPTNILDLASGTGILTFSLRKLYPNANIVDFDMTKEYMDIAESKMYGCDHQRISFILGNADELETVNFNKKFDIIISSYLPKYVNMTKLIYNCDNIISKNGLILMQDFSYPVTPVLKTMYDIYWMPLRAFLYNTEWREASKNLDGLIRETKWIDDFNSSVKTLGYKNINNEYQLLETAAICYATKR